MKILFNSKFLQHNSDSFVEGSYRIEGFSSSVDEVDSNGEEFITLVHSESYLRMVREACMNHQDLAEVSLSPESYQAACSAVGLAVMAAEGNDFAVVRPPGHHAKAERADGFCLFNNIAIAAQKLVHEGKKIFILDIDGHHGDGTQEIFYHSDKVLFCSIHQQYAYPGTGIQNETGAGDGLGYTMNFPLPAGSGDSEMLEAVDAAIQRAREFQADVVGISAGFDGYVDDRLLGLNYTLDGYYACGKKLRQSFDRIFAVLEGGYHFDIKKCTDHFIRGVNNK
ncbi:MAG: histone deacetylase family protein [Bacteroidetes bacterium]|nr:MAG: histone deacetylase family protein [Bacteroidota bacterium]